MATDVSVRIASTTRHGNLRFLPRVAKRARRKRVRFFVPVAHDQTYSTCDISATLKLLYEIFWLALKYLREMRCILLLCPNNALL